MKTIMIVDDEELLLKSLRRWLQSQGFEVVPFERAPKALDFLRSGQQPIGLILTDVLMPEMTGPEFVKAVRSEGHTMPIILMSGDLGQCADEVSVLLETGMVQYLFQKDPTKIQGLVAQAQKLFHNDEKE